MAFEPSREGQLTEGKLGFGYWWVTHKLQVRRWAAAALAAVAVPSLVYGAYGFADWYWGSGVAERAALAELPLRVTDFASFRERNAPRDLRAESPVVIAAGEGSFDLVARVTNPNPGWWADADYRFEAGGAVTTGRVFVLPGESKPVGAFGVKAAARPSTARFSITAVRWNRVDPHETLPNYSAWSAMRLGLQVADAKYVPPAPSDSIQVHRGIFHVTNATAFGYRSASFFVTLQSGSRIVAAGRVTVSDLRAGESREVSASWLYSPGSVTKIEVRPEVNIFDVQNYIAPGR